MTPIERPKICLRTAIDHRIIRLCKKIILREGDPETSEHISIIRQHGARLGRKNDEINVTAELAGPTTTGGIVVILSQPRYRHPFDRGLDAVIQDCPTFRTLDELFRTASCNSLTLRDNVSLVDLLPFTPQRPEKLPPTLIRKAFDTCRLAICAKSPDVVLCAGKIRLPTQHQGTTKMSVSRKICDPKGDLRRLETRCVGQLDRFDSVGLQGNGQEQIVMSRVSGFHPSCAMSHLPEHTILRQLLLLNTVKTCGLYREDWQEVKWMDSIRVECSGIMDKIKYKEEKTRKLKRKRPSHSQRSTRQSRTVSDYGGIYFDILENLRRSIVRIEDLQRRQPTQTYDNLLSSKLSYRCNDVNIVLREASKLFKRHWPRTKRMADLHCIVDMPSFKLERLADVFLQMAVSVEDMLGDLLESKDKQGFTPSREDTKSSQKRNGSLQGEIIVID
ncbi:hypothetical protein F5B22DRAFT_651303 [Xylaria bambusicola]|uniref:uncharacterized protein n=1 Tax=Xylaria bambusicola TaxID=326684 RepID=UPI002008C029|nr:uncharacterized protein F5B22DRAFT_651303 [Xylaria bambusicola]KAI0505888.1 hypothetical protein F5B22DRAFT_651303 [Xylaria bambusicola]